MTKSSPQSDNSSPAYDADAPLFDTVDIRDLFRRLGLGVYQIIGFGALGLFLGGIVALTVLRTQDSVTATRVIFAFDGLERGEYPDHSKFQAEDLRAPDVVLEALRRRQFDSSQEIQGKVRAALNIDGIIPPEVTKQRDRMRAAGQIPPIYIPDEYSLSLLLPQNFPLSQPQRERLLVEIVNVFRDKFLRTHGSLPISIGNAFSSLEGADYYEYELILKQDIRSTIDFLTLQIQKDKTFRSPTTNMSFSDLLKQTEIFSQVRLFESLGQIYALGLSRDRRTAMVKVDYTLRTVEDRLNEAVEQDNMVKNLLKQTQERGQEYVFGLKSQATEQRSGPPLVDQGLVDSLLANDAYNFLVHEALEAGRKVQSLEAERAQLIDRRRLMNSFMEEDPAKQAADIERVQKSLTGLQSAYARLMDDIRRTREDYSRQKFSDAIRISAEVATKGVYKTMVAFSLIGALLGAALGTGLSLLGIRIGLHHRRSSL